jgi:hypothetical protein
MVALLVGSGGTCVWSWSWSQEVGFVLTTPLWLRQYACLKSGSTSTRLHDSISQKAVCCLHTRRRWNLKTILQLSHCTDSEIYFSKSPLNSCNTEKYLNKCFQWVLSSWTSISLPGFQYINRPIAGTTHYCLIVGYCEHSDINLFEPILYCLTTEDPMPRM